MTSHTFLLFMFLLFLGSMGFLYLLAILWDKYFSLGTKRKVDRAMMDSIGEDKVTYSNDYFNKLSNPTRLGENLPTRSCDGCGAGLNPEDKFCPVCGHDISSWIGNS